MNKTCPYCDEEVKPAAKVCPYCRNWLSKYSLRNPVVGISGFCLFLIIVFIGFLNFVHQIMNPGRDFSPYRDSISVVESRMNFKPDEYGDAFYVVTVLTNKCEFAWKNPQLDLRFYNKAGTLIDAMSYTGNGVVYPNGEMAFKTKNRPSHPVAEYDSCKVFVRSAVDPRVRF
jgi:hypothetical protein